MDLFKWFRSTPTTTVKDDANNLIKSIIDEASVNNKITSIHRYGDRWILMKNEEYRKYVQEQLLSKLPDYHVEFSPPDMLDGWVLYVSPRKITDVTRLTLNDRFTV